MRFTLRSIIAHLELLIRPKVINPLMVNGFDQNFDFEVKDSNIDPN